MDDARAVGVDIFTLGQYLQPTKKHLPVVEFVTPAEVRSARRARARARASTRSSRARSRAAPITPNRPSGYAGINEQLSSFSAPIFAAVCSIIILIAGLVVLPTLADRAVSADRAAGRHGHAPSTSARARRPSKRRSPLRSRHAVNTAQGLRYISSTSAQGVSTITCDVQPGHQSRHRRGRRAELVQSAVGLLAADRAASRRDGFEKLRRVRHGHRAQVEQPEVRHAVPEQLRSAQRRQRSLAHPRRLAGAHLRAAPVRDAHLAQSRRSWPARVSPRATWSARSKSRTSRSPPAASAPRRARPTSRTPTRSTRSRSSRRPQQFANIILRANPNGGFTRLGDVARIELGAQDYSTDLRFDGSEDVVGMGVLQYPDANALQTADLVKQKMAQLADATSRRASPGRWRSTRRYSCANRSRKSSPRSCSRSSWSFLVIFLFLQDPKATLIPAATIPVSLIGAFFVMKIFGFSINTITLFGLTLAAGTRRRRRDRRHREHRAPHGSRTRTSGTAPTIVAMREIQSAVVASSLVLFSVFFPVAFFPGTTGQLYKQFALTITAAITISLFQALTLAPALAARLLTGETESNWGFFRWFNAGLHNFRDWYARTLPKLFRNRWPVFGVFVLALGLTALLFRTTPTAFIPDEDQGYFITLVQAPEGTSLAATQQIAIKAEKIIRAQPEVLHVFNVGGFSFTGSASNRGIMFALLKPWSERKGPQHSVGGLLGRLNFMFYKNVPEAQIFALNPPAINGVGSFGGFQFELEDRANLGLPALAGSAYAIMGAAAQDPRLSQVFTQFRINSPQLEVNVDRNKAKSIGANLNDVFNTMEVDLGSLYVNNFTYLNRSWQVIVQADAPYRNDPAALQYLYVRSANDRYAD